MTNILKVKNLSKSFEGLSAVSNCSFQIKDNSITALIGPNGAGKTTMFNLISGFLTPDSGKIIFDGHDITSALPHKRAMRGIGRTFQLIRIFPELSVIDNVMTAFTENRRSFIEIFMPRKKYQMEIHRKSMELLEQVNLSEHARTTASALSYGQKKLLEIVRAIALQSKLFLLDEPAAGVNRTMLNKIIELIKELKHQGKTVLIIEHDMGFVMNLCESIIVMDKGQEIALGPPKKIQRNKKVLEAYLGKSRAPCLK